MLCHYLLCCWYLVIQLDVSCEMLKAIYLSAHGTLNGQIVFGILMRMSPDSHEITFAKCLKVTLHAMLLHALILYGQ